LFRRAIVRQPGENFAKGLTTADLGKPDLELTLVQHGAYCRALELCGLEVIRLPADAAHPDATFVEDTAVLTSRAAILTRPGAALRVGEVAGIRDIVRRFYTRIQQIEAPGTLDGGDVCQASSHFFIGISNRTNEEGVRQLAAFLDAQGYTSCAVDIREMRSILHLKSGIAYLEDNTLVVTEELADRKQFSTFDRIIVPVEETYSCNCVRVNERVLVAAGFPQLHGELERRGFQPLLLEMSEFRKMDGGLSCLSLRF